MQDIHLVVLDGDRARLSQACDVYGLEPETFEEQIVQKSQVEDYTLHRGTSEEERDNFMLGEGEFCGAKYSRGNVIVVERR